MAWAKLRLILCTLALVGLCSYSALEGPRHVKTVQQIQKNPARFHGEEINLRSHLRVTQLLVDGFMIEQKGVEMYVRVPAGAIRNQGTEQIALKVGDSVSLRGRWHREGYLWLSEVHVPKGWPLRVLLSSVTVLALLILLVFNRRKLCL